MDASIGGLVRHLGDRHSKTKEARVHAGERVRDFRIIKIVQMKNLAQFWIAHTGCAADDGPDLRNGGSRKAGSQHAATRQSRRSEQQYDQATALSVM